MYATFATSRTRIGEKAGFVSSPAEAPSEISTKIRSLGSVYLRVLGGSMIPWIRSGDLVFIERSDFAKVAAGDMILFERDGRFFVHRIVGHAKSLPAGKSAPLLITKGDALDEEDAPVSAVEFLGRVTRIYRGSHHINLESLTQLFLGRLLARFSRMSRLVYGPLRFGKHVLSR